MVCEYGLPFLEGLAAHRTGIPLSCQHLVKLVPGQAVPGKPVGCPPPGRRDGVVGPAAGENAPPLAARAGPPSTREIRTVRRARESGGSPEGKHSPVTARRGGSGNRTRVQGFAGPCLSHSAIPPQASSSELARVSLSRAGRRLARRLPALPSGRRDSNPRPSPWQGDALPTEPRPRAATACLALSRAAIACVQNFSRSSPCRKLSFASPVAWNRPRISLSVIESGRDATPLR